MLLLCKTRLAHRDQVGAVPGAVFPLVLIISREYDSAIGSRTPHDFCALCVIQHYCGEQGIKECNRANQKVDLSDDKAQCRE